MAKYRSLPVEIEATQWFKVGDHPAVESSDVGNFVVGAQGRARVDPGDWIITEPHAELGFYPCKPDVFARKYEPVTEIEHKGTIR